MRNASSLTSAQSKKSPRSSKRRKMKQCPICDGEGTVSSDGSTVCPRCNGEGSVPSMENAAIMKFFEQIEEKTFAFYCPGCKGLHHINKGWSLTGSDDAPTIRPSVLVNGNPKYLNPSIPRCHLFVTDGEIQFLPDCNHALVGMTIPMVPVEDWWKD